MQLYQNIGLETKLKIMNRIKIIVFLNTNRSETVYIPTYCYAETYIYIFFIPLYVHVLELTSQTVYCFLIKKTYRQIVGDNKPKI